MRIPMKEQKSRRLRWLAFLLLGLPLSSCIVDRCGRVRGPILVVPVIWPCR
ncbi:MAG: hypothetical protein Fur0037_28770 [Planctomycetota bacterium]